jgi:hypothetical protein
MNGLRATLSRVGLFVGKDVLTGNDFDGFNSPIEAFPLNLTFSPVGRNSVARPSDSACLAVGLYSGLGSS